VERNFLTLSTLLSFYLPPQDGLKRKFGGRSLSPLHLSIETDDGCEAVSGNFDF